MQVTPRGIATVQVTSAGASVAPSGRGVPPRLGATTDPRSKELVSQATKAASFWDAAAAFLHHLTEAGSLSLSLDEAGHATRSNVASADTRLLAKAVDGTPDFELITRQGGTVKGAIPPNDSATYTLVSQKGAVTYYAAQVTLPGKVEPVFVRGVSLNLHDVEALGSGELQADIARALKYVNRLPKSLAECEADKFANIFDISYDRHPAVDLKI